MSVPAMATVYTSLSGAFYVPPEHNLGSSGGPVLCAVAAASHRHAGDLSCLFSSPSAAPRVAAPHEDLGALWHDRSNEPAAVVVGVEGYSYPQSSSAASPFKLQDHLHRSPVSLFHSPASSQASRSPSVSWLAGRERDRLFSSFVRNALGSCICTRW